MSDPQDFHGHKTLIDGTRVALTEGEAREIWEGAERAEASRAERLPTVVDCLKAVSDAEARMRALGWRKGGGFSVRPGDQCAVVQFGSTGIFSGRLDEGREYVHFAGCVAKPEKCWLKPLADLTDEERERMDECDRDNAEWMEGEFARWSEQDQGPGE